MSGKGIQAYAKIVGFGWEYYMTKPKIILGRGGNDISCDVLLCNDSAVSRQHFWIRFAPEHQAIEVKNLSKNGILIDGEFVRRDSDPVLLTSQAEIAYGKEENMRVSLLLPAPTRGQLRKSPQASFIPLIQWIGEILVTDSALTPRAIHDKLRNSHAKELQNIEDYALFNSVRHVLTQNDHIFHVVGSALESLPASSAPSQALAGKTSLPADVPVAKFALRVEEKDRFVQFAQTSHALKASASNGV